MIPCTHPHVFELLARQALALDRAICIKGVWAIPDNVADEVAAGGHELPSTWIIERDDGRRVWFFSDGPGR